jgi:hypothetical protein
MSPSQGSRCRSSRLCRGQVAATRTTGSGTLLRTSGLPWPRSPGEVDGGLVGRQSHCAFLARVEGVNYCLRSANGVLPGSFVIVERHWWPEVPERVPGRRPMSVVLWAVGDMFPLDVRCRPDCRISKLPVSCLGPRMLQPFYWPAAFEYDEDPLNVPEFGEFLCKPSRALFAGALRHVWDRPADAGHAECLPLVWVRSLGLGSISTFMIGHKGQCRLGGPEPRVIELQPGRRSFGEYG